MPNTPLNRLFLAAIAVFVLSITSAFSQPAQAETSTTIPKKDAIMLKYEKIDLKTFDEHPMTLELVYNPDAKMDKRPVILMPGHATAEQHPAWLSGLLEEGYMVAAFTPQRPPDPDPERRPIFLYFDERFANGYAQMGYYAPRDTQTIFDYFKTRPDINIDKVGWVGSSSTGIPGLAVATQGPRLAAVVAFVATGAYEEWIATWKPNGLWKGKTDDLWPETKEAFKYDPIKHVEGMYPTAVLMVSGGDDKVVDPATARSFMQAARPYYKDDPNRLRLVIYDGMGHNLPLDVVKMYVENWFHLYLHPTNPAPVPEGGPKNLKESVEKTQITGADHGKMTGSQK